MIRKTALHAMSFGLLFWLCSCAYITDESHQDVMFTAPGAENAQCDVYIEKLRYQVFPPQTINLMKSNEDMEVTCIAPGNRARSVTVPAKLNPKTLWGGPPGMVWDYASEAANEYPAVVVIDFSKEKYKPNPYPRHNNEDVHQPEDHDLEEYLPGELRLNSDRNKRPVELKRREEVISEDITLDTPIDEETGIAEAADKGSLNKVVEQHETAKPIDIKSQPMQGPQSPEVLPEASELPALEDQVKAAPISNTTPVGPVKLYPGQ